MRNFPIRAQIALLLLLFATLIALPVLMNGVPTRIDGQLHFYRLLALHWAVQNGQWYPRWSPDMVFGFGAPVFNFYPPFTYWVAEIFLLLGLPAPAALQTGYLLACLTLVCGSYQLGKNWLGSPLAGLTLAICYGFAPYLNFNMLQRGAYPELWGMALLPWVVWALLRLLTGLEKERNFYFSLTALLAAALIYAHSLSAVMAIPLLGGLALAWGGTRQIPRLLALALGVLGLSAAWWLPVLRESQFVQLTRTTQLAFVDFRNNWNSLSFMFALPRVYDPLLVAPPVTVSVNRLVALLALTGALLHFRRARWESIALSLLAVSYIALQLPISQPLWEHLPGIRFLQFPWRLSGALSLLLAMLALPAAKFSARFLRISSSPHLAPLALAGLALAGYSYALGWSFHAPNLSLHGQSVRDIPAYEQRTGQVASTTTGEFVNIWAETLPDPATFAPAYQTGELPVKRLQRHSLPSSVQILSETAGWESVSVRYRASQTWDATFNWLLFPQMHATLDGTPIALEIIGGQGLGRVPTLPTGEHTLLLERRPSAAQRWGGWLSLVGLCLLGGFALSSHRHLPTASARRATAYHWSWLFLCLLLLLGTRLFWLEKAPSPWRHSRVSENGLQGVAHPLALNFGNELTLLGWDARQSEITLYWQARHDLQTRYSVGLYLHSADGKRVAQFDRQNAANLPTEFWLAGQYGSGLHSFPPDLPAGEYSLFVSVYAGEKNLDLVLPDASLAGTFVEIGKLRLP